jgi:hypothetical protein
MKENLNKREEFGEGGESVIERRRFVNCFVLIWSGSFLSHSLSLSRLAGQMEMRVECGTTLQRTDTAQRRIVGGDEAGFGTFPWQVKNTQTN